ncbi:hypothetical protein BDZ97DRAFT_1654954 [Flammula alnicola]|nr:hypothetical protein BDZ97DRAFT_1654954 [Flammula alnicola]
MQITVGNTIGALEIGSIVAVFLFGIVTLQCHVYFSRFGDDRPAFRVLVASIWLLELGHTIALTYQVYNLTIMLYGKPQGALRFPAFGVVTILGGLITTLVQTFFAYRVWTVLPNPWRFIGVGAALASCVRCIMAIYAGVKVITLPTYYTFATEFSPFITALLAMGAAIDLTIAASMVYFLFHRREKSLSRVTRLIDRLIAFTIPYTTFRSMQNLLIISHFQSHLYIYIYVAGETYHLVSCPTDVLMCPIFSRLNARSSLRDTVAKSVSVEVPRPTVTRLRRATSSSGSRSGPAEPNPISIEMQTTTEFKTDDSYY